MGDNFDAGVWIKGQTFPVLAVTGKYAFLNEQEEGFSLSGSGWLFLGQGVVDSSGFYGGPVLSYKAGWFGPCLITRYNWVS